jgi:hypothetical protein
MMPILTSEGSGQLQSVKGGALVFYIGNFTGHGSEYLRKSPDSTHDLPYPHCAVSTGKSGQYTPVQ